MPGDGCDAGGDAETYCFEPTKFIDYGINLLSSCPLRVEDGFSVVKDQENFL